MKKDRKNLRAQTFPSPRRNTRPFSYVINNGSDENITEETEETDESDEPEEVLEEVDSQKANRELPTALLDNPILFEPPVVENEEEVEEESEEDLSEVGI